MSTSPYFPDLARKIAADSGLAGISIDEAMRFAAFSFLRELAEDRRGWLSGAALDAEIVRMAELAGGFVDGP